MDSGVHNSRFAMNRRIGRLPERPIRVRDDNDEEILTETRSILLDMCKRVFSGRPLVIRSEGSMFSLPGLGDRVDDFLNRVKSTVEMIGFDIDPNLGESGGF